MQKPYRFSDDTELLSEIATELHGGRCIEIGCGNCHVLRELTKNFSLAVGTDIVLPDDVKGVELVLADRASCFRDCTFDVALCNPPYLPSEEIIDVSVDAGVECEKVIEFFEEAIRVLRKGGILYILLSSLSCIDKIMDRIEKSGYTAEVVKERRLFFETLSVYRVMKGE
jgi:release factor glutamine methyltransferase